ncbi:MAG: hypothetical protein EXS17_06675 [Phycisphaerales bacterium]|nr:hypothetical protein [Phycisphaerales bacterium]
MFKSPGQRNLIAVEFCSNSLRLLQLAGNTTQPVVQAAYALSGVNWNSQQANVDEGTVRRLRDALRGGGFSGRACALALPSKSVLTECIEVPTLSAEELKETVAWTAVDRLGGERDELVAGHIAIRIGTLGATRSEVLLIAARRAAVNKAIALLNSAGLEPRRAELGAMAALRMAWNQTKAPALGTTYAFLNLESDHATLAVLNHYGLLFHRAFAWESSADINPSAIPMAGAEDESHAWRWRQVAEEILLCLRHVERRAGGAWPEAMLLSGAFADEPGIATAVRSVCGAETRLLQNDQIVDWSKVDRPAGPITAWNTAVAIALPCETTTAARTERKVA